MSTLSRASICRIISGDAIDRINAVTLSHPGGIRPPLPPQRLNSDPRQAITRQNGLIDLWAIMKANHLLNGLQLYRDGAGSWLKRLRDPIIQERLTTDGLFSGKLMQQARYGRGK